MQGALHRHHRGAQRSVTRPATKSWATSYARNAFQGAPPLDPFQARHFALAAGVAAEAGVKLLFLELPTSPQLAKTMPRGAVQGFRDFVTTVVRRHGFRFVALEDLHLDFDADDLHDGSHLGYRGATKLTTVAAPFAARELEK